MKVIKFNLSDYYLYEPDLRNHVKDLDLDIILFGSLDKGRGRVNCFQTQAS